MTSLHYILKDHLGSWTVITDEEGAVEQELSYDAWGNLRNPGTWCVDATIRPMFDRGFTGHEHYDRFKIINANARLYDPVIGRFFSPDPFVQTPDFSQNYNRYSYCLNNPVMYSDPDGESFTAAVLIIGAIVGIYSGGVLANNSYNPLDWDYSSLKTWGYMIGGGLTGLASAGAGLAVAATDIAFCNTLGIMVSSTVNSAGTWLYTDGETDFTINFGVASYNVSRNEWGYLGKKGNSIIQNIGYGIGGLYNTLDLFRFFTWDVLSYQDRFSKLENYSKNTNADIPIHYGGQCEGKCGNYDPNNKNVIIYDEALSRGWGWAKSSLCHEVQHYKSFSNSEFFQYEKLYMKLQDYYAYCSEVQNAKFNGLSLFQYNQVMNNCLYYARVSGLQNMPIFSNYNVKMYLSWLVNSLGL